MSKLIPPPPPGDGAPPVIPPCPDPPPPAGSANASPSLLAPPLLHTQPLPPPQPLPPDAQPPDGRDSKGRFAPGNPGKQIGTRHKTTVAIEQLVEGQWETLHQDASDNGASRPLRRHETLH